MRPMRPDAQDGKCIFHDVTNALSVFQRYVNHVLKDLTDRGVVAYIDDILIYAKTEEELVELTK